MYSEYLKKVYSNSPILSDKWPPTPSKKYINLVVVKSGGCRDDYIGYTLQGNVMRVLELKKKITIEQILEAEKGRNKPRLVLIEGAPGIGKSTLAWELCRKWEEFSCMKQYSLVILLRLREEEVQKITNVCQLFCSESFTNEDKDTLAKEVSRQQGRGILFILDGFDELPNPLQHKGFLLNLIMGHELPDSTVIVTSRPSATDKLLISCRPLIQKRVEILGFTQKGVEDYASSIFSSDPEKLEKFKNYTSPLNNPAINSLMYVPLNAAVIVEIFRNSKGSFLPKTLTEVYKELCLTIINRYLKIHHPLVKVKKFENLSQDLSTDLYEQFLLLSEVAFEAFKDGKIILNDAPHNLTHFGFLDSVTSLYGGEEISYNFLHLTVQEFFAAYHIAHLGSSGLKVFQQYGEDRRWNIVWRFVAGLTKFKEYEGFIDKSIFIQNKQFTLFLFQCLFEARTTEYFSSILNTSQPIALVEANYPTSLDAYAIGYCIANFCIGVSWHVNLLGVSGHSFTCGLNTNQSSVGDIEELILVGCPLEVAELNKSHSLCKTTKLHLGYCQLGNNDMIHLSELIPHLTCLKNLSIAYNRVTDGEEDGLLKVLHQLYDSEVTQLDIRDTGLCELLNSPNSCQDNYFSAIKRLIDPALGKLDTLNVGHHLCSEAISGDKLVNVLSTPSSLKFLMLYFYPRISPHTLHLKNNTHLVTLSLFSNTLISFNIQDLVDIVNHNKTLQHLSIARFRYADIDAVRPLVKAVYENNILVNVDLGIVSIGETKEEVTDYMTTHHKDLTFDSRIAWARMSAYFWSDIFSMHYQ